MVFHLEQRGGIYVSVDKVGADILIDWLPHHTTGFLSRTYLEQNAEIGEHEIEVRHKEYKTWYRRVEVEAQTVTPLYPFLVPEEYETRVLASTSTVEVSASSTEDILLFDEYNRIARLFDITKTATSTKEVRQLDTLLVDSIVEKTATASPLYATPDEIPPYSQLAEDDIVIWYDGYTLYAYWDDDEWLPARFCNTHSCVNPMPVLTSNERITHVDFYPGRDDVILYTLSDGLYVAEIDKRPWPVNERIFYGEGIDFRIENNNLYVKDGDVIVHVET